MVWASIQTLAFHRKLAAVLAGFHMFLKCLNPGFGTTVYREYLRHNHGRQKNFKIVVDVVVRWNYKPRHADGAGLVFGFLLGAFGLDLSGWFFLSGHFWLWRFLIDIVDWLRRDAWAAGLLNDDFLLQRVSWIKSDCLCFRYGWSAGLSSAYGWFYCSYETL